MVVSLEYNRIYKIVRSDTSAIRHKIASVWYEGNTCNMHLLHLSEKVKEGVESADMVGMRFNTNGQLLLPLMKP